MGSLLGHAHVRRNRWWQRPATHFLQPDFRQGDESGMVTKESCWLVSSSLKLRGKLTCEQVPFFFPCEWKFCYNFF